MTQLRGRNGDPQQRVQQVIDGVLRPLTTARVLEAGCGSMSRIHLGEHCRLTGIDISSRQLEKNTVLDEKILGDVQTHHWTSPGFDLIVCWDVIEHLEDPAAALRNLAAALNPGGAMVLAFPNFWSLKGLVTKLTPFKAHAWFYQYILGDRRRVDELDQFPTPFRQAIALNKLHALFETLDLEAVYEEVYEGPVQRHMRRASRIADFGFACLGLCSRLLSLGLLDLGLSDCVLVVRRKPGVGIAQPMPREKENAVTSP